jgi:peptidoglycan/xylan/chitin deacetylase (PgdA/CDA1 family)
MTHPSGSFWALPPRAIRRQLADAQRAIADAAGAPPAWFRAPAGLRNHTLHPELERLGLRLAHWSARGFDGVSTDPAAVLRRLAPGIRPGAVILLHEGRPRQGGGRLAPTVLQGVLASLKAAGLRAGPPPDLCRNP